MNSKSNGHVRRRRLWLIGMLVLMVAGCAGAPPRPSGPAGADSTGGKARVHSGSSIVAPPTTAGDLGNLERRLRAEVAQWLGTPHRMGGATRRGVDCSGFVQRLYREMFGRRIPRSTALQVQSGRPVGESQLCCGDLVFFKVPGKGRHVGIYLGEAQFAHASTSRGVTVSSLEERYWRRAYWTARRYLNTPN
jgi:cell wall-associated NlpC family hydrolase